MNDYYTLVEIMSILKWQNMMLKNTISYLSVFFHFNKDIDSINYDFDYVIEDDKVVIKLLRKNDSQIESIIAKIKNQNEGIIIKDKTGNYQLNNTCIATLNVLFQKRLNEIIDCVSHDEFLNNYFNDVDLNLNDNFYHLIISPLGLCLEYKDNKKSFELVYDAKTGIIDCQNNNISIEKILIPKSIFSEKMQKLNDETLKKIHNSLYKCDLYLANNYSDITYLLDSNSHGCLIKRK